MASHAQRAVVPRKTVGPSGTVTPVGATLSSKTGLRYALLGPSASSAVGGVATLDGGERPEQCTVEAADEQDLPDACQQQRRRANDGPQFAFEGNRQASSS
jgi:hypothetical protein